MKHTLRADPLLGGHLHFSTLNGPHGATSAGLLPFRATLEPPVAPLCLENVPRVSQVNVTSQERYGDVIKGEVTPLIDWCKCHH